MLIDGSIDRRAASSPAVADGLVIATGAVLSEKIEEVVAATKDAVDLVRLPAGGRKPACRRRSTGGGEEHLTLERRLVLNAEPAEIAALLREHPHAGTFHVDGALSERFLEGLLAARTERAGRDADGSSRAIRRRCFSRIEVRAGIDVKA